jgi:predicted acyltransferase
MSPEEIISVEATPAESGAANGPRTAAQPTPASSKRDSGPVSNRIVSLDVFRGMTIAGMILVNNSGGPSYGPLDHAEWNGWTHTDLIFPFFMFIAGASMALSFSRRKSKAFAAKGAEDANENKVGAEALRRELMWHAVRRGATIFLIGLFLNLYPWFFDAHRYATLRIPGVLQRIGFCYVFAGMIYLFSGRRARIGIIATALLAYWAAMKLIPVPGYGAGDLAPTHNLAAYIDNAIFGVQHMWQHRAWDPEGLLSSVPAICTMLIGTFVGELFVSRQLAVVSSQKNPAASEGALESKPTARSLDFARDDRAGEKKSTWQYKVKRLVGWGVTFVLVGEVWNIWFPINKNLWTSSYVMFTAGYAMLLLAASYWVVDVKGWRKWATPFLVFGSNAILVFTLSTWVTKILLITRVGNGKGGSMSAWSWVILNSWRPHFADVRNSSLAFALSYVLIWLAVMWWFWRKKIFVKI